MYAGDQLHDTTFTVIHLEAATGFLVPTNGDPNNIWFFHPYRAGDRTDFMGLAGATARFPLLDGRTFEVKGPWCSNPDSLFELTGIDLRTICGDS